MSILILGYLDPQGLGTWLVMRLSACIHARVFACLSPTLFVCVEDDR